MRATRCIARTILLSAVCVVLLGGAGLGCGKAKEEAQRREAEIQRWKSKYQNLVRENEKTYQELEDLEKGKAALEQKVQGLQEELEDKSVLEQAQEKLKAVEEQVAERDATIEGLTERIDQLKEENKELEELVRPEAAGVQLEELRRKVDNVRKHLLATGHALFRSDDYEAALRVFTAATELGGDEPQVLFEMAYCHSALGNEKAAVQYYEKAAESAEKQEETNPRLLAKLHNNWGTSLVWLAQTEPALEQYQKALQVDKDYGPAHFNLARLYHKHLQRPQKAIESYRRHVALGGIRGVTARQAIRDLLEEQKEGAEQQAEGANRPASPESAP